MKISQVKLRQVSGTMDFPGEFWEERLIRPVDLYPRFQAQGPGFLPKPSDGHYKIEAVFIEIESDDGAIGIGGPVPREQAFIVDTELRPLLLGADPLAHGSSGTSCTAPRSTVGRARRWPSAPSTARCGT
jgi:hypothetical protein